MPSPGQTAAAAAAVVVVAAAFAGGGDGAGVASKLAFHHRQYIAVTVIDNLWHT